jgi:hypothetical protein
MANPIFHSHSLAGIGLAPSSRGSSLTCVTPALVSWQVGRGPQPGKIKTASLPRSIHLAYHRAGHLSRPFQFGWSARSRNQVGARHGVPLRGFSRNSSVHRGLAHTPVLWGLSLRKLDENRIFDPAIPRRDSLRACLWRGNARPQ